MSIPPVPRPSGNALLITTVVVVVIALASVQVALTARSQDQVSTVRQGQVTGQATAGAQRTDQAQLTCAIWAALSDEAFRRIPERVRAAADRICSDVPTPAPTPTR